MVVRRRKKNVKLRGHKTHGYGSMKKHRGAGNRGGRGLAGSGKRADQKKSLILKLYGNEYFGRRGFRRYGSVRLRCINVGVLDEHADVWKRKGFVKEEGGFFVVDLGALGYDKLLGGGKVSLKWKIKVDSFSDSALKKIESVGGVVEKHGSVS